MNLHEQLRLIAERLLEKSRANEVYWTKEPGKDSISSGRTQGVSVRFPQSAFRLEYVKPTVESDFIKAAILRDDGLAAGELEASEENSEDWRLLSALWADAQRCLFRWDEVLVDLEKNLRVPGKIGIPPKDKQPSR